MKAKDYGQKASEIWNEQGKDAADAWIDENCPDNWKGLASAYCKVNYTMGIINERP